MMLSSESVITVAISIIRCRFGLRPVISKSSQTNSWAIS